MKVLIWDWNGTLLNDATIAWGAFNDLLVSYGHQQISFAHYQEIYGHPASRMYEAVGVDLGQHDFDRISADYHDFYRARSGEALLHHDTRATLQQMATQGRRQAIVSALAHELLPSEVAAREIEHFFESISGVRDKRGHGKIDLGREVVRSLGVSGADITVIGDSSHDAELAQSLGAHCFLVARGLESAGRLAQNGFPVLDSFERLPELLCAC